MNRIARPRGLTVWRLALTCSVVACSSDQCLGAATCPISTAAEISVTASNAPTGIAGLTMTITGPVGTRQLNSCSQGPGNVDSCTIYGGPGDFRITLSAPGYQPSVLSFTVAGSQPGCCGVIPETRALSVVMQPTSD